MDQTCVEEFRKCFVDYMHSLLVYYFTREVNGKMTDLQKKILDCIVNHFSKTSDYIGLDKLSKETGENRQVVYKTLGFLTPNEIFESISFDTPDCQPTWE